MIRQLGRFASVGAFATLIHVVVALFLGTTAGVSPQLANLGGFLSAVMFSYVGHLHFTFGIEPQHSVYGPRFLAVAVVTYISTAGITHIVHGVMGMPFTFAILAVGLVVPVTNFVVLKFWAYSETASSSVDHLIGLVLSAAASLTFLAVLWDTPVNHDTAWYLIATEKWLAGATLYSTIVEVNPPLNFYFTVPAVLISQFFHLSLANAQFLMLAVICFFVLLWCWNLLSDMPKPQRYVRFFVLAIAITVPFLSYAAQREHLMVMLIMPWVIGKLTRGPEGPREIPSAVVATLGVCLKPFFVLFPLAITVVEVVSSRSLKPVFAPSNLVFLSFGMSYVAATALLHPQYLSDIVPTARYVYGEYGGSAGHILVPFAFPGLLLASYVMLVATNRAKSLASRYVFALMLASVFVYLVQWKGFRYQFYPIVCFAILGAGWILAALHPSIGRPMKGLALVALVLVIWKPLEKGTYSDELTDVLSSELEAMGADATLMVFSTSLPSGPAVALRREMVWASRYPALWLVPGVVDGLRETDCTIDVEKCETLALIGLRTRTEILDDLTASRPEFLIFDYEQNYIDDPTFDWAAFLSSDRRYAAFIRDYVVTEENEEYAILLRQDASSLKTEPAE